MTFKNTIFNEIFISPTPNVPKELKKIFIDFYHIHLKRNRVPHEEPKRALLEFLYEDIHILENLKLDFRRFVISKYLDNFEVMALVIEHKLFGDLKDELDINFELWENIHRPLLHSTKNIKVVELLLENNYPLETLDKHGNNALFVFCKDDFIDIQKLLIEKGINVHYRNIWRDTAICHTLLIRGQIKTIRLLLSKNVSPLIDSQETFTRAYKNALHGTVHDVEILFLLIDHRLPIETTAMKVSKKQRFRGINLLLDIKKSNPDFVLMSLFDILGQKLT